MHPHLTIGFLFSSPLFFSLALPLQLQLSSHLARACALSDFLSQCVSAIVWITEQQQNGTAAVENGTETATTTTENGTTENGTAVENGQNGVHETSTTESMNGDTEHKKEVSCTLRIVHELRSFYCERLVRKTLLREQFVHSINILICNFVLCFMFKI